MRDLSVDVINELLEFDEDYSISEIKNLICTLYKITDEEYDAVLKDYIYDYKENKYILRVVEDEAEQLLYLKELMQNKSFKYFLDNIDDILDLIKEKKTPKIKIDLESKETIPRTLRVNKEVAEAFENFCDVNNRYSKGDLVSMAIKEYIEKYK